jgi:hypothetical protein
MQNKSNFKSKGCPTRQRPLPLPAKARRFQFPYTNSQLHNVLSDAGIGASGFQHDFGIPKAGKSNDTLVDKNCRSLIEGLQ